MIEGMRRRRGEEGDDRRHEEEKGKEEDERGYEEEKGRRRR